MIDLTDNKRVISLYTDFLSNWVEHFCSRFLCELKCYNIKSGDESGRFSIEFVVENAGVFCDSDRSNYYYRK